MGTNKTHQDISKNITGYNTLRIQASRARVCLRHVFKTTTRQVLVRFKYFTGYFLPVPVMLSNADYVSLVETYVRINSALPLPSVLSILQGNDAYPHTLYAAIGKDKLHTIDLGMI